jgi:hypothetical protein
VGDKTATTLQLNVEQFDYLQARHEQAERAVIAAKTGDNMPLQMLWQDEGYQHLFSGMDWNDVYDRYQDTPGYDDTLSNLLHKQLQADLDSRSVEFQQFQQSDKPSGKLQLNAEQVAQLGLRKLNE